MVVWIIVAAVLIVSAVLIWILLYRVLKEKLGKNPMKIRQVPRGVLLGLKRKYMKELAKLEDDVRGGRLTIREAYQRLSLIIRLFVFEVTGIRVQEYTLSEIEKLNYKPLTALVSEYYVPEFAREADSDIMSAIYKTRGVIDKWT